MAELSGSFPKALFVMPRAPEVASLVIVRAQESWMNNTSGTRTWRGSRSIVVGVLSVDGEWVRSPDHELRYSGCGRQIVLEHDTNSRAAHRPNANPVERPRSRAPGLAAHDVGIGPARSVPVLDPIRARRLHPAIVAPQIEIDRRDQPWLAKVHLQPVARVRRAVTRPSIARVPRE